MSRGRSRRHQPTGPLRALGGGLALALAAGALAATAGPAPAAAAAPASAVPPGDEPGVTMRVFQVPYDLANLCTLKAGQTPNVDELKQVIDWETAADFGGFEDRFISQALANLSIEEAGAYEFRLTSDDGSRLSIDDEVVIDHDGLHGAEPKTGSVDLTAGVHELFVEHFEAGGGQQLTLEWKKPGDAAFSLVPTSVLSTEADVTRVVAPGNKECEGAQDSPGDGLQLDAVNPGYDLTNLRPAGFEPQVSGLAWQGEDLLVLTWGGTGDPVNQTANGELYRLEGVQTADSPDDVTYTKVAGNLREPMGLAVVDVDDDGATEVYVTEKHQLSRLVDTDDDGDYEPAVKEAVASWPYGGNFHEFAFGLLYRDGKFLLNLSVAIDYGGNTTDPQPAPNRGTHVTVDAQTGEVDYVAGGLRTPNGLTFGPEGDVFVTDNQGGWLPASKLVHIKPGRFFNHYTNPDGPFDDQPVTKPVLWLPQNEIANSPSTPVMVPDGPFEGQMWISDVTYGGIQRAFLEKVDGEYQGAVFRMTQGLEAGVNRLLLGPDGSIYAGGLGAGGNWGQAGKLNHGLQKLTPNGTTPFEMKTMEVVEGGFEITYTQPLSEETLTDLAEKYVVKQWRYQPTAQYGGPKIGEETLDVTGATASEDGLSVTLQVAELRPDRVVHLRSPRPFSSESGETLWSTEAWYTLNSYPGYQPPPAPVGVYELEDQELVGTARVDTEHAGYSGGGYVAGISSVGAGVTTAVSVDEAGTYDLALRYTNGPNPFQGPKKMSLVVNGERRQITLPSTTTWQNYETYRDAVELDAGENTVEIRWAEGDDGHVNLDLLQLAPEDGVRYEAEEAQLGGGAVAQDEHAGYTGSGYVGGYLDEGASTTFAVHAAEDGEHPVTLRYANGPNPFQGAKTVTLTVNGESRQVSLPDTGAWAQWGTIEETLPLTVGENTVTLSYEPGDDGNVNLDHLDVRMPDPVVCEPGVSPDDEFDGDRLDPCRWTTVVNEVRSGYRVADGALQIDALPGDLSGAVTTAKNLVLQPAPGDGSWAAETTVSIDGTDDYLQGGLVVWGGNANYGKAVVMRTPQGEWKVELARVTGGNLAYVNSEALPAGAQEDIRLRLWAAEGQLRAAYSLDDGATWTEVGTGYGLGGLATPLIGVAAYNGAGTETARFEDFTVAEPPEEPETCTPAAPEAGYEMLYDGTRASLAEWEMADGGTFARQPDCSIKSVGAFGLLWHPEPIDHDYSLKLDWMMPGDDNSGVFVGFPDPQGSAWNAVEQGHEIQIDPTDDPDSTTGAVYNFAAPDAEARDAALNPPGEWNSYEIVVEGDRIRVYLNGALVNDYTDTDPNRMNLPSHIGLQTHGDGDDVFFRDVQIKDLSGPDLVEPQLSLRSKPGALRIGQEGRVTVTVEADGTTPTGEVTLSDGTDELGTRSLVDGRATFPVGPYDTAGARTLTASYAGDDSVAAGESTWRLQVHEPVLRLPRKVVDADRERRSATVRVACQPAGIRCAGTARLVDGGHRLGQGRVSVAGGEVATLRAELGARARALLRDRAQVRVTLVVALDGGGRERTAVTLTR